MGMPKKQNAPAGETSPASVHANRFVSKTTFAP
jgi:hypothetical protein